jgi:pyrroloquinoline quinone biosynthesis protein D
MRIDAATVPKFMPGVRLQYSEPRQQWIVQAPERVLMPDETAVAVLKRCDGRTTVAAIGEALAREYDAPPEVVTGDVVEMLQDLADKGVVSDGRA